jgi:hypothetical protein
LVLNQEGEQSLAPRDERTVAEFRLPEIPAARFEMKSVLAELFERPYSFISSFISSCQTA